MKIPAVIVDDEKLNISFLKKLLNMYCPDIQVIATAASVEDGVQLVNKHKPKILFLDIEIRDKTGFDLLKLIDEYPVQVILVSAHDKYAFKAFKYAVLDYLLKPVSIDDLMAVVKRAKARINNLAQKGNSEHPVKPKVKHLSVHHKDHIDLLQWKDIIHMDSLGSYTEIYTMQNKKSVSSRSLKQNEEFLPPETFIRVHNSHIVNIEHIERYIRSRFGSLLMCNGIEIPISPKWKKAVTEILNL